MTNPKPQETDASEESEQLRSAEYRLERFLQLQERQTKLLEKMLKHQIQQNKKQDKQVYTQWLHALGIGLIIQLPILVTTLGSTNAPTQSLLFSLTIALVGFITVALTSLRD